MSNSNSSSHQKITYVLKRAGCYFDRFLDAFYLTTRVPMIADSFVISDPNQIQNYYTDCYTHEDWLIGLLGTVIFFSMVAIGSEILQDYEKKYKSNTNTEKPIKEPLLENTQKKKSNDKLLKALKGCDFIYGYGRDLFSGIKNGRQAVVNVGFLLAHFHANLYGITNPIGIAVGGLYCILMLRLRKIENSRRDDMKKQEDVLERLAELIGQEAKEQSLDIGAALKSIYSEIFDLKDPDPTKIRALNTYGARQKYENYSLKTIYAILDGAYTFGCGIFVLSTVLPALNLITASALSPTILIILGAACVAITLFTLISELNKEYELQRQYQLNVLAYNLQIARLKNEEVEKAQTAYTDYLTYTPSNKIVAILHAAFRAMIQGIKNVRFVLQALSWLVQQFFAALVVLLVVGISYGLYLIYRDVGGFLSRFNSPNITLEPENKPAKQSAEEGKEELEPDDVEETERELLKEQSTSGTNFLGCFSFKNFSGNGFFSNRKSHHPTTTLVTSSIPSNPTQTLS